MQIQRLSKVVYPTLYLQKASKTPNLQIFVGLSWPGSANLALSVHWLHCNRTHVCPLGDPSSVTEKCESNSKYEHFFIAVLGQKYICFIFFFGCRASDRYTSHLLPLKFLQTPTHSTNYFTQQRPNLPQNHLLVLPVL